jgi:hypothetical protein
MRKDETHLQIPQISEIETQRVNTPAERGVELGRPFSLGSFLSAESADHTSLCRDFA